MKEEVEDEDEAGISGDGYENAAEQQLCGYEVE